LLSLSLFNDHFDQFNSLSIINIAVNPIEFRDSIVTILLFLIAKMTNGPNFPPRLFLSFVKALVFQ